MTEQTVWIGIDCGKKGAIAFLWPDGFLTASHVPVVTERKKRARKKTKSGRPSVTSTTEYDCTQMLAVLRAGLNEAYARCFYTAVAIERQQGMPTDSKKTVFAVGRGQGLWEMAVASFGLQPELIRPVDWKKNYVPPKAEKELSIIACKQLYPNFEFRLKKDEALAEAILIADYLMRKRTGLAFLKLAF